jgi:hypothetical protein
MRAAGRADRGNPAAGETNQTAADDADGTGEPPANKIELGSTNEQECPFPNVFSRGCLRGIRRLSSGDAMIPSLIDRLRPEDLGQQGLGQQGKRREWLRGAC